MECQVIIYDQILDIKNVKKWYFINLCDIYFAVEDDIDGVPMEDEDSLESKSKDDKKMTMPAGFVPSRWETVDPDQVEAQAMTTSKWEELEQNEDSNSQDNSMDSRQKAIFCCC